eukprot:scaffold34836_cov129-Isochrysis_galbana.AAC.5
MSVRPRRDAGLPSLPTSHRHTHTCHAHPSPPTLPHTTFRTRSGLVQDDPLRPTQTGDSASRTEAIRYWGRAWIARPLFLPQPRPIASPLRPTHLAVAFASLP